MTPVVFLDVALKPALWLLPPPMTTPEARALVLTIALQESQLAHRRQVQGPARSYLQFERAGIRGVLTHRASSVYAESVCAALDVPATVPAIYRAIEFSDVLACGLARLLLWTLPDALPGREEPELAWLQYLDAWRPGRPQRQSWDVLYARAWDVVAP